MTSRPVHLDKAAALLHRLIGQGVVIYLGSGDKLLCDLPAGHDPRDVEALRRFKPQILYILQQIEMFNAAVELKPPKVDGNGDSGHGGGGDS